MKRYLDGRRGILLFRNGGAGHHTELWDETHIIQDGKAVSGGGAVMNESSVFGQPRVLLWAVSEEKTGITPVPDWLQSLVEGIRPAIHIITIFRTSSQVRNQDF